MEAPRRAWPVRNWRNFTIAIFLAFSGLLSPVIALDLFTGGLDLFAIGIYSAVAVAGGLLWSFLLWPLFRPE